MAYAEQDIVRWFAALHGAVHEIAGADLPDDQAQVQLLVKLALHIVESVVLDHNRIANVLEELLRMQQEQRR